MEFESRPCRSKEKIFLRRCLGLTRNLRRCGRQGNWKFFCDDHRLQPICWVGFIVFTVLGAVASIQSAWFPHLRNRASPPAGNTAAIAGKAAANTAGAKEPKSGTRPSSTDAVPKTRKKSTNKTVESVPPSVVVNNAPNGIAIGGGIVTNPTVNNYGPRSRRLTADERNNLKAAIAGSKGRVIIWFFVGDDTQALAQDFYDVFHEAGWEMAAARPEGAIQVEPQKCDIALFLPASSVNEPAAPATIEVVTAMRAHWMHLSVCMGFSDKVAEGWLKLVVAPRWEQ